MIFNYLFLFNSAICFVGSEFTWRNSGSSNFFVGKQFFTDEEAYNFYNSYARNRGFGLRRKGIDKSRRPPHKVICRKFCCNKEGLKKLCDKRQDGLSSTVESTLELRVLLRYKCVFVYYQTENFGLSLSLLILIHMNY